MATSASHPPALLQPGEVVSAFVRNIHQERHDYALPKPRPVVLVYQRTPDVWAAMGLTTNATFATGEPRYPIPHWEHIPLDKAGYLWGPRLPMIPERDIRTHIGWAPVLLRKLIVHMCMSDKWPDGVVESFVTPTVTPG